MARKGMIRFVAGWAFIGLVAPSSAWSTDSAPISLAQDGNWVANYEDASCQLLGKFGTGKSAIVAIFTRFEPSDIFHLSLQGENLKPLGNSAKVMLGFGPGQPERETLPSLATLADKPLLIFGSQRFDGWTQPPGREEVKPPPVTPAQEATVSHLDVRLPGQFNYRLMLGSMGKPMATVRHCMDGLLEHWGYSPAAYAAQSRRATPSNYPGNWVSSDDYPLRALKRRQDGIVQFRLDLDEAGKILNCHILSRTNPDEFADLSCRLLTRRARFEPALDAAGDPTRSFFIDTVRFVIPR